MTKRIDITDYGAVSGGTVLCTTAIQNAIDRAAELECEVMVPAGTYLTGALFLKSNMSLHLAKGAVLLGTTEEGAYPDWRSCMADAEPDGHTGIVNILEACHVHICGAGRIDGQNDSCHGGNVVVHGCNDVQIEDFVSVCAALSNVHISFSTNVAIKGLDITADAEGIRVDSCNGVLIERCKISGNGNNVCIKACKDVFGMQDDRYCENIMVRGCEILEGSGITLESGNVGSMRNISVCDNTFKGTQCGFSVRAVGNNGGPIEDVEVTNLKMKDVSCCFCLESDCERIPEAEGLSHVRNVRISQITASLSEDGPLRSKAFAIAGLPESLFEDLVFEDMQLQVKEYGTITNVRNLRFVNVAVDVVK